MSIGGCASAAAEKKQILFVQVHNFIGRSHRFAKQRLQSLRLTFRRVPETMRRPVHMARSYMHQPLLPASIGSECWRNCEQRLSRWDPRFVTRIVERS